jgi:hypothetical protein
MRARVKLRSIAGLEESFFAACCGAGEEDLGGVDVALGDRRLGVAGFVLNLRHGVAGSGFVGQGRVAKVVEGSNVFGNAGLA